ncbi:hypothetical protein TPA0906_57820 [Streptomyces olivaceus]|nr:hypothetical protein TPA0906_57820 [Streptomyces olivaceus]
MKRHPEGVGQSSARLSGRDTRSGSAGPMVNGRRMAVPSRVVQHHDQHHEPVVDDVAVPQSLNSNHTARKGCGAGGE